MLFVARYLLIFLVLYYLFSDIDTTKLSDSLLSYSLVWVSIAMVSVLLSDLLLGFRWKYLSNFKCGLLASFESIVISGLLNFILPAKLGEISKIAYLKKVYKLRVSHGTHLLIFERLLDIVLLAILATYVVFDIFSNLKMYWYFSFIIMTVIFVSFLIKSQTINILINRFFTHSVAVFLTEVKSGLSGQLNISRIIVSTLYTLIIWASFFLTVYIFLNYVADFNLPFKAIFTVFVISSIAMSLPLTPGGVGVYQAGVVFSLGLFNIPQEEALVAGIALHLILLIPSFAAAVFVLESKCLSLSSFKG